MYQDRNKEHVQSVVCKTIGEIEDFIEMYGPAGAGMLHANTPIHSYNSEHDGVEFMWSPTNRKWYVAELGDW
jgi:hypothetical protein